MTNLIIGESIISLGLLREGNPANLKNSTYDLTIGDIFAIGPSNVKERRRDGPVTRYFINPQEMVFVLSKEHFSLPSTVTGIATLRTTFTKDGLLALNVGIIDPCFNGPISTALLNFSDRPVEIYVGQKFFRVLFFEHESVSDYKPDRNESIEKSEYIRVLEKKAYSEFPKTYLNIPSSDDEFYYRNFWKLVWKGMTFGIGGISFSISMIICVIIFGWYVFEKTGFSEFFIEKYDWIKSVNPF